MQKFRDLRPRGAGFFPEYAGEPVQLIQPDPGHAHRGQIIAFPCSQANHPVIMPVILGRFLLRYIIF